jgi:hypothetical protein
MRTIVAILMLAASMKAQSTMGVLKGQVTDPSASAVPNATVTVRGPNALVRQVHTDPQGLYAVPGLPPGQYDVRVEGKGFTAFEALGMNVPAGTISLNVPLTVAMETQTVTVSTDTNSVTTDPSQNVGALVLKGEDLAVLSDDPDDLANDLQALAGPAAGPNGGQIYIDGFTGGQLPPKSAIREIRINSNPFSAEYDRLGFGRIEILTKPGSDKFRGQVFTNIGNKVFNSRNPFVTGTVPDYSQEFFGGNVSGPLGKKASFFVDFDHRITNENALVVAQILDPSLNIVPYNNAVVTPQSRTDVSPRVDYQINGTNTLSARYRWSNSNAVGGVGGFALPTLESNSDSHSHTVQLTETAVLGTHAVNESRFQFFANRSNTSGTSKEPTINVQSAFTGGGSPFSVNFTNENHYEFQNYTTYTHGTHQIRFGARVRGVTVADQSTSNYNGSFTFAGGRAAELDPTTLQPVLDASGNPVFTTLQSIQMYRYTELLLKKGLSSMQAAALGYGPSIFTLTAGIPLANVDQVDAGLFVQDDWRVLPNVTVSAGLRYEMQTNLNDHANVAPRVGIAWAPGAKKNAQAKTVIRVGAGMFYDRFSEDYTLNALRLNGVAQEQFVVRNPNFFSDSTVPTLSSLTNQLATQAVRDISSQLRAPRIFQTALGVERQLPWRMSVAVNWTRSRGWDQLRSRNINAPLPGTYDPANPNAAVRPYGTAAGDIYLYESSASFKQNQLMTNVTARISPKLSLFGYYVYGHAESNSDGAGSFPANSYDLSSEWGRAGFDVRQRVFLGGSIVAPLALSLNPFIILNSGVPFNITTGTDTNGDGLFTERPSFATDLTRASVVTTPWGVFDTKPIPGQTIIPRNYGEGPGQVSINLRLSRSWGFGEAKGSASGMGGGDFGGPRGGGGGRGGPGGGGGFMTMGRGGMGGGATNTAGKRYVITLGVQARNVLNHVNYAAPVGVLTSPFFGQSTAIAGGFGPGGGGAAGNRRLELQLRFTF